MRKTIVVTSFLCFFVAQTAFADNWPMFRGLTAGVADGKGLPTTWDTKTNVAWAVDVPGRGWSSPVVWGDRVFLTTVVREGKYEDAKKGLYFGGEPKKTPDTVHYWKVLCLDVNGGKIVWEREAAEGKPSSGIHIKNSFASETPVTDGKRLYVYFGNQGVFCYDLDGKPLWSRKLDAMPTKFSWGTASSPALYKNRLFIVNDNEKVSYLLCLNAETGEQMWRVPRNEKTNWSTPFVWENDQRTEIVTAGTNRIRSYDLDGKLLWECAGMSNITIPTPFTRHGLLYVASGYVMDKNKPMYAIKPGATGNITLEGDETKNDFIAWKANIASYNPTPLVYGDYLYVLYDMGFLSCYEAKTGKKVYEKERVGGPFTVSPWAYDGKVFCLNEDGDTFVIAAGPKFEIIRKNKLEEMCMACPAVAGKGLLVRTLTKLYRIEEKP